MRVPTIPWLVWSGGPCIIYFWYIVYIQSIRFTVTDTTTSSNKLYLFKERERDEQSFDACFQKNKTRRLSRFWFPTGDLGFIYFIFHISSPIDVFQKDLLQSWLSYRYWFIRVPGPSFRRHRYDRNEMYDWVKFSRFHRHASGKGIEDRCILYMCILYIYI